MSVWPKNNEELMLRLTVIATFFAAISAIFSFMAIQDAKESTMLAEQNVNKTTEIAKWYYEPQPQLNLWTSEDYELNKSGVVFVDEWADYINGNGFNVKETIQTSAYYNFFGNISGIYQAPSYLACCKIIKIFVYNSGRGSIVFPLISFDLEAKNKSDGIIFKVYEVKTSIDKLEYDPIKKGMFEFQEFVENQQILMPYGSIGDFPPYQDEKGNSYFVPPGFTDKYTDKYVGMAFWEKRDDILGPFGIGTIPPGESANIELKIFSAKGWLSTTKEWSESKEKAFSIPPRAYETCKEGYLNITVQSLNTKTENRSINLKTGTKTKCYNYTAEFEEKMNASMR